MALASIGTSEANGSCAAVSRSQGAGASHAGAPGAQSSSDGSHDESAGAA